MENIIGDLIPWEILIIMAPFVLIVFIDEREQTTNLMWHTDE